MKIVVGRHSPDQATFYCFTGAHELCQDWPVSWTSCECPCHIPADYLTEENR